eukprot:c19400_g1_i1 orf=169-1563(-)
MMSIQATNLNSNGLRIPTCNLKLLKGGFGSHPLAESACPLVTAFPRPQSVRQSCACAQLPIGHGKGNHINGGVQAPHGLFLHDLMDQAGIDTSHAKAARESFVKEVTKLASSEDYSLDSFHCSLALARAALEVSSEDDALVSHSPVALPVDSYLERLNSMAMEFARHHLPSHPTPDDVLSCLDNYLYGYKGFQRTSASHSGDARDCYLNMVLTRRVGNPAVLAIIYCELVKVLYSWGVIQFSVDMVAPKEKFSLPRPAVRRDPSVETIDHSVAPEILTPKGLLVDILTVVKHIYWPWKLLNGSIEGSNFLKAADAANHGITISASTPVESLFTAPSNIMGSQVASARAAKHRLQRGIWSSASFGDMRRALAATERLVLLGADKQELRDYGILLYHCGLFEPSLLYLSAYKDWKDSITVLSDSRDSKESAALENVMLRLRLILAEQRWNIPTAGTVLGSPLTDPW